MQLLLGLCLYNLVIRTSDTTLQNKLAFLCCNALAQHQPSVPAECNVPVAVSVRKAPCYAHIHSDLTAGLFSAGSL